MLNIFLAESWLSNQIITELLLDFAIFTFSYILALIVQLAILYQRKIYSEDLSLGQHMHRAGMEKRALGAMS